MVKDLLIANNWNKECLPRRKTITNEKYIYRDSVGYCIRKMVDGENIHFGWFRTLKEAIVERDLLVECGWDLEALCNSPIEKEEWLTGMYGKTNSILQRMGE